jgi:hypothetical protein
MTPEQKLIEEFVSNQAGIDGDGIPGPIPIAAVRWKPGKLFWAELGYPGPYYNQSRLHVLEYDRLEAPHSLGVWLLHHGRKLAYVAPWPEWHDAKYDRAELAVAFERRDAVLADPVAKRRFDQFFEGEIG